MINRVQVFNHRCNKNNTGFYKKLGSGRSAKSFLIGFLFFEFRIIDMVANTAAAMLLDI